MGSRVVVVSASRTAPVVPGEPNIEGSNKEERGAAGFFSLVSRLGVSLCFAPTPDMLACRSSHGQDGVDSVGGMGT